MAETKKSKGTLLKEKLFYDKKNAWDRYSAKEQKVMLTFAEPYKKALDQGKTEREFYHYALAELQKAGFKDIQTMDQLKAGDKVYRSVRNKGLMALIIGKECPCKGFNLVGSHIDSPRLDVKPNPLYEKNDLVLLKTHYYGGIKKYQWAATPLALHGIIIKKDGSSLEIALGEDPKDPVFTITDLLPHLGREQMSRTASDVIRGEELNLLVGSLPYPEEELKERFKLNVLALLNEHYGIVESDLLTAELEIVPAHKARDVGFDRSLVGGYGQDDRVCAYTSLRAICDAKAANRTQGILLFDKEETGSNGNTGALSLSYLYALKEAVAKMLGREATEREYADNIEKTCLLSSDVTNAYDPTFSDVSEPLNSSYCGYGLGICKYTGAGGKGGTTDANAEFFADVVDCLNKAKIPWQVSELGKVDAGGGGTIAKFFANYGMQVIDCGVPVLSMHSCFEVTSKLDIYQTYKAYLVFMEKFKERA